jgi:hypothetical protein
VSDSVRELVAQLVNAGEWPEPELLERILAQGDEAIEPLRELLRQGVRSYPEGAALWFAARLLCSLRAIAASPDIIAVLRQYDPEQHDFTFSDLALLGPGIVDPLLDAADDATLGDDVRSVFLLGAVEASRPNPAARERVQSRILASLRWILDIARAGQGEAALTEDQREDVSRLLDNLYFLDAARARTTAREALALGAIERDEVKLVESLIGPTGPIVVKRDPGDWLDEYREAREEHRMRIAASRRLALLDAGDFGREFGREAAQRLVDERKKGAA